MRELYKLLPTFSVIEIKAEKDNITISHINNYTHICQKSLYNCSKETYFGWIMQAF